MREKVSEHFFREEFACKGECCCGHSAPVDSKLVEALEELRELVNRGLPDAQEVKFHVLSGFRCAVHNKEVLGAEDSQHVKGRAADIIPVGDITVGELAALADDIIPFRHGGIGIYDTFVHLDVRGHTARWDNRTK